MTMRCPCCNSIINPKRLLVDLNSNTIAFGEETVVCVSPPVVEVLYALNEHSPRVVRYGELNFVIWGSAREPFGWLATIRVYISGARRVVERFGGRIDLVERRGYRLVMPLVE